MSLLPQKIESKWEQLPAAIQEIEGRQVIVDKRGLPKFYLDGSPYSADGRPQCIGKNHANGYRCQRYAVLGYSVCQVHGAGSPFKGRPGGRPPTIFKYKKNMPADLASRYEEAVSDERLLSLDNEIALITTRITQLLEHLPDVDEVTANIEELIQNVAMIKEAKESHDVDKMLELITAVTNAIGTLHSDISHWDKLTDLFIKKGKLTSYEIEHRKIMKYYITAEEASAMVQSIIQVINRNVKDQVTKNIIAAELKRLFEARSMKQPT